MEPFNPLENLRPLWVARVAGQLARGERVRANLEGELDRFFGAFLQAMDTGSSLWIEPFLENWAQALTQIGCTDADLTLPTVIEQMLLVTTTLVGEMLPPQQALNVVRVSLPIFLRASRFAVQQETRLQINLLEEEIKRTLALVARLEKSKSDFISVAAHELKTPLTLITGYTSMLTELLPHEVRSGRIQSLLDGMEKGNRRLNEIVEDMIDVSLIDNHLLDLSFQPVLLLPIFESLFIEYAETLKGRALKVCLEPFEGRNLPVWGDPERLYQAFRHLVTNAIKYTPDGGTLTITGRTLPGFVEILVRDTGIGIDPENHERIFEKFGMLGDVSLHSSGKHKFKGGGPGLGLPIVKGIVEAHHGSIWVESEGYDEIKLPGTTFHVLLPLAAS